MSHCTRCGAVSGVGDHTECERRLRLEPPRYCRDCGRRMVVQVTPTAWTARCSRHGVIGPAPTARNRSEVAAPGGRDGDDAADDEVSHDVRH